MAGVLTVVIKCKYQFRKSFKHFVKKQQQRAHKSSISKKAWISSTVNYKINFFYFLFHSSLASSFITNWKFVNKSMFFLNKICLQKQKQKLLFSFHCLSQTKHCLLFGIISTEIHFTGVAKSAACYEMAICPPPPLSRVFLP